VCGVVLVTLANEQAACRKASLLRAELPTREDAELDAAWSRYQEIAAQSGLGLARRRVSGAMSEALLTHADRVIADFRQERPTVRERQWQQARTWLGNAVRLDPGNAALLSRLRYCEGQLSRIDGEARVRSGQRQEADRHLHDAVARFEEAAKLDRSWPDPWLGLLRTYVVGLEELDKAVTALNEAERRGHRGGRREFTLLGEAYAARGEREARECVKVPSERTCSCLERSAESFRQAVSWFDRVQGSPDTSRALQRAHGGLAVAVGRLVQLECE
jgi:tetratricopeptide (TPR) repeat protein